MSASQIDSLTLLSYCNHRSLKIYGCLVGCWKELSSNGRRKSSGISEGKCCWERRSRASANVPFRPSVCYASQGISGKLTNAIQSRVAIVSMLPSHLSISDRAVTSPSCSASDDYDCKCQTVIKRIEPVTLTNLKKSAHSS